MTVAEKHKDNPPSNEQVQQQLSLILSSPLFTKAQKLSNFLEYIVTETLGGRAGRIKGFTIGSEVFGRNESHEADSSTIVRVEAGRLRRRLMDYYRDEGQNAAVYIKIPKGTYVPIFELTEHNTLDTSSTNETFTPTTASIGKTRKNKQLIISLLILFAVFTSLWIFYSSSIEEKEATDNYISRYDLNISGNPSIMVFPFENDIKGSSGDLIAKGITEDIITDLSSLSNVDVIALSSVLSLHETMNDYRSIAKKLGVKYILHGSLRSDGKSDTTRISAQLYDNKSGRQLWAQRFDRKITNSLKVQDELATIIVQSMSGLLTDITFQNNKNQHLTNRETYELYKQAMSLVNPPADPWRLIAARRAFERVIELDPGWAGGYAGSAYTYAFHVWWGHSKQPEKDRLHAIELANQALELDPSFGLAYSALAFAHLSQRDFDKALSYSSHAIKYQPSDPYLLAYHAFILTANGNAETGLPFAQRALRINPAYPRTPFLNILGMINFHAGKHARALELLQRNIERGGPNGPGTQVYLAASLASLGRLNEAKNIYKLINLQKGEFNYIKWLNRSFKREEDVNKVLDEFQKISNK